MTTPYVYLLHHIPTDTYYYGVKWKRGCDPDQFWISYFTSSNKVKQLRKQYGDGSFEHEIRHTFKTGKQAAIWESKVLRRMRVLDKPNQWLNRTTNTAWLYDTHPMKGRKIPGHGKHLIGRPAWNKGLTKDDPRVAKHIQTTANTRRGKPNPKQSVAMKAKYASGWIHPMTGRHHTAEANEKNRLAHLRTH